MAHPIPTIKLSVYAGDKLLSESTFQRDVINIGKMSRSHVRVDDDNVSRMHCAIEVTRSGSVEIADLGSTNGTFVNGERITRVELQSGDEIIVGGTRFVIDITAAAAAPEDAPKKAKRRRKAKPAPVAPATYDAETYLLNPAPEFGSGRYALEVVQLWGKSVLRADAFHKPVTIQVGEERGNQFVVPEEVLGATAYTLVEAQGDRFALNLGGKYQGEARVNGDIQPFDALRSKGKSLELAVDTRAKVEVGGFTFLVGYQEIPNKPKTAFFKHFNIQEQIYMALSLIAHAAFLIMLSLIPEEQLYASRDSSRSMTSMIQAIQIAEKEAEVEEEIDEEKEEKEKEFKVETKEMEVKEEPDNSPVIEVVEKEKKKDTLLSKLDPKERKEKIRQDVQNKGLNKILNNTNLMADLDKKDGDILGVANKGRVLAARGEGGELSTFDPFGGQAGAEAGSGGFDVPTTSVGGRGGTGGPSQIADLGKEAVTGGEKGLGKVSGLNNKETRVKVDVLTPQVSDGYDRETVRRIIRSQMGQIKWCYQKALQREPDLGGKIVLGFLIGPNGATQGPKVVSNNMGTDEVGECIAQKALRWQFPAPPNGAVVKVSYPFLFKAK
jgi:hypothetical protein